MVSLDVRSDKDLKPILVQLNRAKDWIEFRTNTWLVWTSLPSKTWYQRIKPLLNRGENIFICGVDIEDRGGWMPKAFWQFVRSKT
jgi:hypothetical protein